jgi:hypothetical protein
MAMLSPVPDPESELTHDELVHQLFDLEADTAADGFIVFSLGPDFQEAALDDYDDMTSVQRSA